MPRVRLGVAVLIPDPVAGEVNGLRRALGDPALERIPAHLTLVPPVNVSEAALGDALAVVRAAAARARPFRLTIGPPETFHPVNPVVYLGVGGDVEDLLALRDGVFRPPLARTLTWPFVPHVTIADEMDPELIPTALSALASFQVDITVDRVHVLQESAGRMWSPIADAAFRPPAVIGRGGLEVELSVVDRTDPEVRVLAPPLDGDAESSGWYAVVARQSGRVVGVAEVAVAATVADLVRVVVDAAVDGEGVEDHLVAAARSEAADRGCVMQG